MRSLTLTLALLTGLAGISQVCDYEIDEKDEFTGEYKKMVDSQFPHGKIEFTDDNGSLTMKVTYNNSNLNFATEAKGGDQLMLKLEDETMITLTCLDINPSGKEKKPTLYTTPTYEISADQMAQLAASEITMARFDFNGESVDVEPGKYGGKVLQAAQCILKN